MQEILPIASGIVLGVLAQRMRIASPAVRIAVLVVLSLALGFVASWVNGELALSWGFVSVDTALVLLAAVVTTVALAAWERRGRAT